MSTFCELVCSDLWLCIQHFLWAYALTSGCVFSIFCGLMPSPLAVYSAPPGGLYAPPLCQIGHRACSVPEAKPYPAPQHPVPNINRPYLNKVKVVMNAR